MPEPANALLVIDVQRGFDDAAHWGVRNNPACEANVEALLALWRRRGGPVVFVRHDSPVPTSPLAPSQPGNAFKDVITGEPDVLVTKQTNSAFYGEPDLHAWLQARDIGALTI
jgi:nicotinamidase-related amidase